MQLIDLLIKESTTIVIPHEIKRLMSGNLDHSKLVELEKLINKIIVRDNDTAASLKRNYLEDLADAIDSLDPDREIDQKDQNWLIRDLKEFISTLEGTKYKEEAKWTVEFNSELVKKNEITVVWTAGGGPGGDSYFRFIGYAAGEPVAFDLSRKPSVYSGKFNTFMEMPELAYLDDKVRSKFLKTVLSKMSDLEEILKSGKFETIRGNSVLDRFKV